MRLSLPILALPLLGALLLSVPACNDAANGPAADTKSHDYKVTEGRDQLIHLADHGPILETKHDKTAGTLTIFVFTDHHEEQSITEAPVLQLTEGPTQVTAKGEGTKWVFTHELLKGHPHDSKIKIKIGGETYNNNTWHPVE